MIIRPKPQSNDLLFSCSGAADLAEIGDLAVRCLHKGGEARMFCLAGIGGKVDSILEKTLEADRIFVVDGCESDCAKRTVEGGGFTGFTHLRISDLGWEKGKTPVTPERVDLVANKLRGFLAGPPAEARS